MSSFFSHLLIKHSLINDPGNTIFSKAGFTLTSKMKGDRLDIQNPLIPVASTEPLAEPPTPSLTAGLSYAECIVVVSPLGTLSKKAKNSHQFSCNLVYLCP